MSIEFVDLPPQGRYSRTPWSQHFSSDGVGGGTFNMNGVYTAGLDNGVFHITPAVGQTIYIARVMLHIQDTNIAAEKYGNETLTNGVLFQAGHGTTIDWDIGAGISMKSAAEWSHHMHDLHYQEFGTGDEAVSGRMTFTRMGGHLRLIGDKREFIRLVNQDDMSGLVMHEMVGQGFTLPTEKRVDS